MDRDKANEQLKIACTLENYPEINRLKKIGSINNVLWDACEEGDTHLVEIAIRCGANDFDFGLARACESGNMKIINKMVQLGATDFNYALKQACWTKQIQSIEKMIELGANPDEGLYESCLIGDLDLVNKFISFGAEDFDFALRHACEGGHHHIIDLMEELGARDHYRALECACYSSQYHVMERLINFMKNEGHTDYFFVDYKHKKEYELWKIGQKKINILLSEWLLPELAIIIMESN